MRDTDMTSEQAHAGHGDDSAQGLGRVVSGQRIAERLAEVEARSEDLQQAIRNALGESEYARHRAEADLSHAYRFAIEGFARALLPFKDALETALCVDTTDAKALKDGLALSLRQMDNAFWRNGLREICPQDGEPFDVERHRPLPERDDASAMVVAGTQRKGYELNGRVLRAAIVTLRRGGSAA